MAELEIKLATGGSATVKGSPAEVAEVLRLAGIGVSTSAHKVGAAEPVAKARAGADRKRTAKAGPQGRVSDLVTEGFFKAKRDLGAVRDELKGRGHVYNSQDLSPVMIRLVRDKLVRRSKDDAGHWVYVEW